MNKIISKAIATLFVASMFTLSSCSSDSPNDQGGDNNTDSGNQNGDNSGGNTIGSGDLTTGSCGGEAYQVKYYFCYEGKTYNKCGGEEYNPGSQFCSGTSVVSKCGGETFTPSLQFCSSGAIYPKCDSKEYNPATQICYVRDIYKIVTIGTQTWMAENLKYNASGSKCYDNVQANCDKYGRLYDWLTAMNTDCDGFGCTLQISEKHRGICPLGWHIPSEAEWGTLFASVGGTGYNNKTGAGKYLKASNGWGNYNGLDSYDFKALPGGGTNTHTTKDFQIVTEFQYIGERGEWWSYDDYGSMFIHMEYDDAEISPYTKTSGNLLSVRCVKD